MIKEEDIQPGYKKERQCFIPREIKEEEIHSKIDEVPRRRGSSSLKVQSLLRRQRYFLDLLDLLFNQLLLGVHLPLSIIGFDCIDFLKFMHVEQLVSSFYHCK